MAEERPRIGFVGLGMMGRGMARNLTRDSHPLVAMAHRRREALEELLAAGAGEAASVEELAAQSDIVIICVTGTPDVESIVYGGGLLAAAGPGHIVIDCSTSEPSSTARIAA